MPDIRPGKVSSVQSLSVAYYTGKSELQNLLLGVNQV